MYEILPFLINAIPALAGLFIVIFRKRRLAEGITILCMTLLLLLSIYSMIVVCDSVTLFFFEQNLFIDSFSAWMLFIIALISLLAAIYSLGYISHEYDEGKLSKNKLILYYSLFNFFVFTMNLLVTSNDIFLMWIAVEATTLSSAFLVGIYKTKENIEAAWKYAILCTTGIAFGLYGTVLMYSTAYENKLENPLLWTYIFENVGKISSNSFLLRLTFALLLVGYGTKAGLAPFHTWLPDAHSEAPSPISALFSGVLIECAMYTIMRYYAIFIRTDAFSFVKNILLLVGLASIVIAVFSMVVTKDLKRLLAFSSVENMGIVVVSLGFGGMLGIFAAAYHLLNHSIVKSMLFLCAGNILISYKTRTLERIKALKKRMPITAILLIVGCLAIIGTPPFCIFFSEFMVIMAGVLSALWIPLLIFISGISVMAVVVLWHGITIVFDDSDEQIEKDEVPSLYWITILILGILALVFGFYLPYPLQDTLNNIVELIWGA